jgi:dTDP-4-amino-4,6-dideoxygalactose transaminase
MAAARGRVYNLSDHRLSCFLIEEKAFGRSRDELIGVLDAASIESRPVWKPMHLQPLYAGCAHYAGEVAEDLFRRGICLPSSSSLSVEDQIRVINQVRAAAGSGLLSCAQEELGSANGSRTRIAPHPTPSTARK